MNAASFCSFANSLRIIKVQEFPKTTEWYMHRRDHRSLLHVSSSDLYANKLFVELFTGCCWWGGLWRSDDLSSWHFQLCLNSSEAQLEELLFSGDCSFRAPTAGKCPSCGPASSSWKSLLSVYWDHFSLSNTGLGQKREMWNCSASCQHFCHSATIQCRPFSLSVIAWICV